MSPSSGAGRRPSRSVNRMPTAPIYRPMVDGNRLPTCVNWTARDWVGPVRTQVSPNQARTIIQQFTVTISEPTASRVVTRNVLAVFCTFVAVKRDLSVDYYI